MKEILLLSLFAAVAACGYFEGDRGPAGKDGKSPEAIEPEKGEAGDDAVVSVTHCERKLVYPHDKNPYVMHYAELKFSEGTTLVTLDMVYSATGQQLFREAVLVPAGGKLEINGQNWLASKAKLVHKASKVEYQWDCK